MQQCAQAELAAAKLTTAAGPSMLSVKAGGGDGTLPLSLSAVK